MIEFSRFPHHQLVHLKTDASYIHIKRDDNDNAFTVAFRTPPHNNTGVAHILEHVTLCGSAKYPGNDADRY